MAAPPVSSLADRALEALMGRSDRETVDLTEEERIEEERRRVMMLESERARMARTAQLDLFDLSDIGTEQRAEEMAEVERSEQEVSSGRHLDALPPSYSLAEGLDQLPNYAEAEVFKENFGK